MAEEVWAELESLNPAVCPSRAIARRAAVSGSKPGIERFTIGRTKRSDLRFEDRLISQVHCALLGEPPEGGASAGDGTPFMLTATVQDFSRNGTYVNGELVGRGNRKHVYDGDVISLVVRVKEMPDGSYAAEEKGCRPAAGGGDAWARLEFGNGSEKVELTVPPDTPFYIGQVEGRKAMLEGM
jgi:hypothetical protein